MYALFARIAEDELEVPDESDPCDDAKTTVVIIKVRDPRTACPLGVGALVASWCEFFEVSLVLVRCGPTFQKNRSCWSRTDRL